ncbi:MAG: hypothetical protein PVH41_18535 [Anaerolineae bacterium]|jgi:hypothetical protein
MERQTRQRLFTFSQQVGALPEWWGVLRDGRALGRTAGAAAGQARALEGLGVTETIRRGCSILRQHLKELAGT